MEKISDKLIFSVVFWGLPDIYEYFETVRDFSKTRFTFFDLKKVPKNNAGSQ